MDLFAKDLQKVCSDDKVKVTIQRISHTEFANKIRTLTKPKARWQSKYPLWATRDTAIRQLPEEERTGDDQKPVYSGGGLWPVSPNVRAAAPAGTERETHNAAYRKGARKRKAEHTAQEGQSTAEVIEE